MRNNDKEHTEDFPFDKTYDEFIDYIFEEFTYAFDKNIIDTIMSESDWI